VSLASLTPRQREILEYIRHFLLERGYAPSIPEIGRAFSLTSTATIHKHLRALEERGAIRRARGRQRFVELAGEISRPRTVQLPLTGTVAAGEPIEAVAPEETIEVPESLVPKQSCFLLRVRGDGLRDEQLRDGDLLIVEERAIPENGETVVALVKGRQAMLRRFQRQGGRVLLQPADSSVEPVPLLAREVKIRGVVRGLMRRY
jgi:repressor LexA